jgi:hypothetical protein
MPAESSPRGAEPVGATQLFLDLQDQVGLVSQGGGSFPRAVASPSGDGIFWMPFALGQESRSGRR